MYKSDVVDELKICLPYNLDHFGDVYFYSKDVEITIHSAGLTIEITGSDDEKKAAAAALPQWLDAMPQGERRTELCGQTPGM